MTEEILGYDYIICPFNGDKLKQINLNRMKMFGVNSVVEFKEKFPGYPTSCEKIRELCKKHSKIGYKNSIRNHTYERFCAENENTYRNNPKKCLNCGKIIPYEKRRNTFCGQSCGGKYTFTPHSAEQEKFRIEKVKEHAKEKHRIFEEIKKHREQEYLKNPVFCCICNKAKSYKRKKLKTCSETCRKILRGQITKKVMSQVGDRSHDEIALYEKCKNYYKIVTHNEQMFDGWDADILIHDTKTAILWNGPWHYRQMPFSGHSLKQVQARDKIKTAIFIKNGWNIIVFEDRFYTPETAFEKLKENDHIS